MSGLVWFSMSKNTRGALKKELFSGFVCLACLPVCLPACLFACLSAFPPVGLSARESVRLSVCLSPCLPASLPGLFVCLPACLSVCLPACLACLIYLCLPCLIYMIYLIWCTLSISFISRYRPYQLSYLSIRRVIHRVDLTWSMYLIYIRV